MVGTSGIEPLTSTVSMWRSPPELRALRDGCDASRQRLVPLPRVRLEAGLRQRSLDFGRLRTMNEKIVKSDDEWRAALDAERYLVLRQAGTEPPFSGELLNVHESGAFRCGACGAELFATGDKYDSGSGWPSFTRPVRKEAVSLIRDRSHGTERVEVRCARCDSHLGHVFNDGPGPTGERYCMNSLALTFSPEARS